MPDGPRQTGSLKQVLRSPDCPAHFHKAVIIFLPQCCLATLHRLRSNSTETSGFHPTDATGPARLFVMNSNLASENVGRLSMAEGLRLGRLSSEGDF